MAIVAFAFVLAHLARLPALAILQVTILLAIAIDVLLRQVLRDVFLELLNFVYLLAF